jgi:hypothetical protein
MCYPMVPIEPESLVGDGSFSAEPVEKPFPAVLGSHSLAYGAPRRKCLWDLRLLAEGLGLRGTSRVLEVKLDTIRRWLATSAFHCEQVSDILLRDLKLCQVQVNELWTFVKKNTKIPLDH